MNIGQEAIGFVGCYSFALITVAWRNTHTPLGTFRPQNLSHQMYHIRKSCLMMLLRRSSLQSSKSDKCRKSHVGRVSRAIVKAASRWASHARCVFAGWQIFYSLSGSKSGDIGNLCDGKGTHLHEK